MARRGGKKAATRAAVRKRKAVIHDRLSRVTFGHVERAKALLRHALPPELVAEVDLSTRRGKGWWAPSRLEEMDGAPSAGRGVQLVVRFEYEVDDLPTQSEEQLMRRQGPARC